MNWTRQWPRKRLRFLSKINPPRLKRPPSPETLVAFLSMERIGERGQLNCSDLVELRHAKSGLTVFQDGDVITAKITPCFENGKGAWCQGLPGGHWIGTTELHVLRPSPSLTSRFLYYVTASSDFRLAGTGAMSGAAGQKRVPDDFIRDFPCPVPPVSAQTAICAYLDRETARIDALIEKKERLIALLEENWAALIHRAVTKGVDPNVPMRDSGIPWLGTVPVCGTSRTMLALVEDSAHGTKCLRTDLWKGQRLFLPPLPEQYRFCEWIGAAAVRLDTAIAKIREQIAKFQEYRTALISAAVTGKIDMREASEV